ncbi:MAG: hypothetical protein IPM13_10420 [Phycisphaerales bacterium]|nr:hypothetical protein [Phycisphaerales bacterium]
MATPAGKRCRVVMSSNGSALHVYSDARGIVLQLRRSVPTADDLLTPSFKVAVNLSQAEALALAAELLHAASGRAALAAD